MAVLEMLASVVLSDISVAPMGVESRRSYIVEDMAAASKSVSLTFAAIALLVLILSCR